MKRNIFSKKNLLDEMQEQKLLKLESRGFWIIWWGLLLSILVQRGLGASAKELLWEGILFTIACLYMLEECLRHGIWDRHIRANSRANLVGALLAGFALFLFQLAQRGYWPGALFSGVFAAVLCFVALQGASFLYRKRHDQLEHTGEDEGE